MSLWVKLCGIQSLTDLEWAVEAGADAVGVVLTPSIRTVDLELAGQIVDQADGHVETVGVFHFPERELVERARDTVGFDLYQAETSSLSAIDGIVALPVVHDSADLDAEVRSSLQSSGSGRVLVESAGKGGLGLSPDFERVAGIEHMHVVVLAGGLNPDNVAEKVATLGPGGVDVSSGVESAPGLKDRSLMASFVTAARTAEER